MLDNFMYAINAIFPLILLIGLGYFLKQIRMFDENFFKKANTLVFRVCLPVLLFYNIYNIEDLQSLRMDVVAYGLIVIVILFLLGMVTVHFFIKDPKQKGVILQCVFRSNYAIIGLPVAEALGGSEAAAIASLLSAFSIPLFNILAVVSLSAYTGEESGADIKSMLRKICRNPLIIGVLCGLLALGIRSLIPQNDMGGAVFSVKKQLPFIYSAIKSLAGIASPLALVVLGGQFTFRAVKGIKRDILIGTLWRIVLAPALGLIPAVLLSRYTAVLSFGIVEFPSLIALFGSPVAVSSAIMAAEMENDEVLAGQLVVWTSLGSVLTLFIIIVLMRMIY